VATGISETTAQDTARDALMQAVADAFADADETNNVDAGSGFRWPIVNQDWFFATETESVIDPADIGPRRTQTETITLHASVGSWRPGSDEATELAAFHRAFDLLKLVQNWIRKNDITLGGTVLWCLPGSSQSAGETSSNESGDGRITEIAATFVCKHRIATA
jgi:hypothetical protein